MDNQFKLIIGITGKMRAGKSTVARFLSDSLNAPVISFGGYLVDYAKKNNLEPTRDVLQTIGNEMVRQNPQLFLRKVLDFSSVNTDTAIIEGIRHQSIISAIKQMGGKFILIYIDTPIDIRYERYCSGKKSIDSTITFEEFQVKDNHPVEEEIESLKVYSTIVAGSDDENHVHILNQIRTNQKK